MASDPRPPGDQEALLRRKLTLMKEVFATTRQELLLVDLNDLTPLLERKEQLIREINLLDEALAPLGGNDPAAGGALEDEIAAVLRAILENEEALEGRLAQEHTRLRKEMRDLEGQTRLKGYLEHRKQPAGRLNLKK